MIITSLKNEQVRHFLKLQSKSGYRASNQSFVLEGLKLINHALGNGYEIERLFIHSSFYKSGLEKDITPSKVLEVDKNIFLRMSYDHAAHEGVLAIVKQKEHTDINLRFKHKKPLVIVLESPEKPGNIGAVLRTADALDIDALFIANQKTDIYNPNLIRSSLGTVFSTPVFTNESLDIIRYLKKQGFSIYTTHLEKKSIANQVYADVDYPSKTALVFGNEAKGLGEEWLLPEMHNIYIPMNGVSDSLNLSVSVSVIAYEVLRQRHFWH